MRWLIALLFAVLPIAASAQAIANIEVTAAGGKSITTWHGQADLQALNIALVHPISPRSDVSFVFAPVTMWQPRSWFGNEFHDGNESVRGVSAAILARRTFHRDSARFNWYVEGGTGPLIAQKKIPASTSRFNFMTQFGTGIVLRPASRFPLIVGYRLLHISNGGYAPRNPGLNVSAAIVGVRFRTATTRQH
ncbi:MAG TPA: acyloxyacyl hydrolase [Thermoanaerobaculia bacterium]